MNTTKQVLLKLIDEIPIPFADLTSSKKRPVLVLSNDDYNSKTDDII